MSESNQEGYRSIGWIINKSEQGLYLVVADEKMQKEIADVYGQGAVEIYDCRRHPGAYSFHDLQKWVVSLPEKQTFMIINFHLALQDEESIKRLNFSRDMLEGIGKNFIFCVTPYWDDILAVKAYDFYSFLRLRIIFQNKEENLEREKQMISAVDESIEEDEWKPEELKQKMAEANELIETAMDEINEGHYSESKKLLLKARKIKEKLLGPKHLEIAEIDYELAGEYERAGKYKEAENLYLKSLLVRERVLGEDHPDTASVYSGLADVYKSQGKYQMAMDHYLKAYRIFLSCLSAGDPRTKILRGWIKKAYYEWNPEGDFAQWLKESMRE